MDDTTMKKIAAGTAMAGALGLGIIGFGSGVAAAKPDNPIPNPPVPVVGDDDHGNGGSTWDHGDDWGNGTIGWTPNTPPGQNPLGPPGQVMHEPFINGVPNPFFNVPPGHWDDVVLPTTWQPNLPGVTGPLNLEWNAQLNQWGVYVNSEFVPYPIPLPAPHS